MAILLRDSIYIQHERRSQKHKFAGLKARSVSLGCNHLRAPSTRRPSHTTRRTCNRSHLANTTARRTSTAPCPRQRVGSTLGQREHTRVSEAPRRPLGSQQLSWRASWRHQTPFGQFSGALRRSIFHGNAVRAQEEREEATSGHRGQHWPTRNTHACRRLANRAPACKIAFCLRRTRLTWTLFAPVLADATFVARFSRTAANMS